MSDSDIANSVDLPGGDLLPVPAAAASLGISERHLRRLLTRPEYTGRTRTVTRTTRTGTRTSAGIPPELIQDLREALAAGNGAETPGENADSNTGKNTGQKTDKPDLNTDNADHGGVSPLPPLVVALVAEKDARIADLTAALDHERQAHQRAEALHLATLGEMQDLRRRANELEDANRKLLAALPTPEAMNTGSAAANLTKPYIDANSALNADGSGTEQNAPYRAPDAPESDDSPSGRESSPLKVEVGQKWGESRADTGQDQRDLQQPQQQRPWWRFWEAR